jgi:hypothetical protein
VAKGQGLGICIISQDAKVSVLKPFNEFETDFSMTQNMHSIRGKLHHTVSILNGILDVLTNLAAHAEVVGELMSLSLPVRSVLRTELDQISSKMKSHRSVAQSLLQFSDDICFMVSVLTLLAVCSWLSGAATCIAERRVIPEKLPLIGG